LIERVGPALIEGFVKGLEISIPLLIGLLEAAEPILPVLLQLAGMIAPFAPLLMAFGLALYFIAPLLTAIGPIASIVGSALSWLGGVLGLTSGAAAAAGGGITIAGISLSTLLPIIGIVIAAIAAIILIWQNWGDIVKWFKNVTKPLHPLFNSLIDAGKALWNIITGVAKIFWNLGLIVFEIIRIAFTPLWNALQPVFNLFSNLAAFLKNIFGPVIQRVSDIIKPFIDALKVVGDLLHGVGDWLGDVVDKLKGICFTHAAAAAEVFIGALQDTHGEIGQTIRDVDTLGSHLKKLNGGVEMGIGGGRGIIEPRQMFVEVNAPMTFEAVTLYGNWDVEEFLEVVHETASKGIAEAVSRARYK